MASERKVDRLAGKGSLLSALKRRRLAIEEGDVERAPIEFQKELGIYVDEDDENKDKRKRH